MQLTPRRSPRLASASINGRALRTTSANRAKEKVIAASDNTRKAKITIQNKKRKSDIAITPLRKESGHMLTNTCKPQTSTFQFCGLPEDVKLKYCERKKITDLYEWQKECLSSHQLLRGSNCIISLPTGAGKTLIAEILMLREAILNKRSSILVLPYVAVVQEKINSLAFFEENFDVKIEEYAGSKGRIPPIKRRKGSSIYIATIEKANMIINSLIETERVDSIGLLVIDELHMIGEGSRGAILEQQLIKFQCKGNGQIVGISATLSNMPEMAKFLGAFIYSTNFRPVVLEEYVKLDNSIYKVQEGELVFDADLPPNKVNTDPDGVIKLVENVVPKNSVIIFCPTKKNCENVAKMIARFVPKDFRERQAEEKEKLLAVIKEDNDGSIDIDLETCIRSGIAYHHSGLTHDERKHIEAAYTEGILFVICATSTLAAGVNLPARRVIIKAPVVGMNPLGKAQYLQMIGRAGRPGFDKKGDSITIIRRGQEERRFREMLRSPLMSCTSSLIGSETLMSFILDVVVLKMVKNVCEIMEVLRYSLLLAQREYSEVQTAVDLCVTELVKQNILLKDENNNLSSTLLGSSTYDANIDPKEAKELETCLLESLDRGIIFSSHFHLLYTITPLDAGCDVIWELFDDEYKSLPASEKNLLSTLGLPEHVMMEGFRTRKRLNAGDPVMRLYIALMLKRIWNQEQHHIVAQKFEVERGWLQSVLQSAIGRASAIARFSNKQPSLWPFRLLLPELVQRLSDCVRAELIPLMSIDGVRRGRAHQLYNAGYKTIGSIANANYTDLLSKIDNLRKFQAIKIVNNARALVRDQLDEKMEEIEAMGVDVKDLPL